MLVVRPMIQAIIGGFEKTQQYPHAVARIIDYLGNFALFLNRATPLTLIALGAGGIATQVLGVVITIVWVGVVSAVSYKLVDLLVGLRVPEEDERIGLDVSTHGERAYND